MIFLLGFIVCIIAFIAQGLYRNWDKDFFDGVPESMGTVEAWKGTDNDKWWARWTIYLLGWQAFGPFSKYKFAQWKFPPKNLITIGGKGPWRFETFDGMDEKHYFVVSRCQYYKRWALVVEWPLSVRFHIYWKASDVPVEGTNWTNEFSIKQLLFFYVNHWDTTPVYWLLSFYFGGQWK